MSFLPLPFVLSDSIASIPGTMNFCQKSLGIDIKFAKISIPIGMQLNMDGTAFYVSLVSMMLAKNAGIQIGPVFYISFFIALFLISLTGLGIIAMPSIYLAFGIPRIQVAIMIRIEPILDMFGTAQNVLSNITSSFIISKNEKAVEEQIYNS